jgi:hypothetical protein
MVEITYGKELQTVPGVERRVHEWLSLAGLVTSSIIALIQLIVTK